MRTNVVTSRSVNRTHEGAPAKRTNSEQELRRSVCACLLWEQEFYEDGAEIAERINSLVQKTAPEKVSALAVEAREKWKLRHVPLWLTVCMARHKTHAPFVRATAERVIQRADEMGEILSLYWGGADRMKTANGKLPAGLRRGVRAAFAKFDAYKLGKYNRNDGVRLKDVLKICHPKPADDERRKLHQFVLDGTLSAPDTWEVALSSGADKLATWERLIAENKLGGLAMLRNLRNMQKADVPLDTIAKGIEAMNVSRVLPFRFIAAARFAPALEPNLEAAMFRAIAETPKLAGLTAVLVDVSGSMDHQLSMKSDMTRIDAACGVAMVLRELCGQVRVFAFSDQIAEIPARRGFALRDAISRSMPHSSTNLGAAVSFVNARVKPERFIVITDEQSHDQVGAPYKAGYMINVASATNGVGYGSWNHIDGFSEAVVGWIKEYESL